MPSTRSQSQSQSQSLPLSIISTSSTAVLPRSYEIYLALPTSLPLSSSEQATHHVKAQEMLTDAWRRLDEPEGDLLERRRMLKIGRGGGRGKGKGKEKQKDAREPLWYNATLLHPCTCELEYPSMSYTFSIPPPTDEQLQPLPPHPNPAQIPPIGDGIQPWSKWDWEGDTASFDLDPGLDLDRLEEFEVGWMDATGDGWGLVWSVPPDEGGDVEAEEEQLDFGLGAPIDGPPSDLGIHRLRPQKRLPSITNKRTIEGPDEEQEIFEFLMARKRRKGKQRANGERRQTLTLVPATPEHFEDENPPSEQLDQVDSSPLLPHFPPRSDQTVGEEEPESTPLLPPILRSALPPVQTMDLITPTLTNSNLIVPEAMTKPVADSGVEPELVVEARRRKEWWRKEMTSDASYGAMWSIIGLPHTYPYPHLPSSVTPPLDPFLLLRNLSSFIHPFHPSLPHYLQSTPFARVHWVIPIHGPVLIPHFEDPILNSSARPWASRASLSLTPDDGTGGGGGGGKRPWPIRWTPELLKAFLREVLGLREGGGWGPVSLAFSGTKPDPYLNILPPKPLGRHLHLPRKLESGQGKDGQGGRKEGEEGEKGEGKAEGKGKEGMTPARIEVGDHLRIYMDADKALSFRTWMYHLVLEVEDEVDGAEGGEDDKGKGKGKETRMREMKKKRRVKIFEKARFVLVGERGEALTVA